MGYFKDVECLTGAEKQQVLNDWIGFLDSDLKLMSLTEQLFNYLIQHCDFVASTGGYEFYVKYFENPADATRFFSQFDFSGDHVSTVTGNNHWYLNADYHDLNAAMARAYTERKDLVDNALKKRVS